MTGTVTRDKEQRRVTVAPGRVRDPSTAPDARTAVTGYRTLASRETPSGTLSLLECCLFTGRTHQIRAQLAAAGHPLLGDGKYGKNALNKPYGETKQALCAYRVRFVFEASPESPLASVAGRTFSVREVPFVQEFDVAVDDSDQ